MEMEKLEKEMKQSKFKKICVFCGSSPGKKSGYKEAAVELGKELITGETVGEVKAVADMHQRKAEMAKHSDAFIALPGLFSLSFPRFLAISTDPTCRIILSGYGTLEELLEVIAWSQLGIHDKPVGLLNVDGYYNSLLAFIDKAVEEGFICPNARQIFVSAPTAKELMNKLEDYFPSQENVASKLNWEKEEIEEYIPPPNGRCHQASLT
ncbi:hypothetical protein MTR67_049451 [Solanum verrucosum]|uniref:cytokinin riboside 5'-monophosphate phosphoribohydrolase n=1 Tax=Solanum verrucosum TaxID=315347 RepID=A0AAF0V3G4_SOLVR|nr:hypothetical protein MTR67_049451 [Solanum verrucosum]